MATIEVILTENVKNKGYVGDVVRVALGYARNYLFPKSLAVMKNKTTIKLLESLQKKKQKVLIKEKAECEAIASELNEKTVTFIEKIHEENKLYGSITTTEIAGKIKELFNIDIDKKKIKLPNQQTNIKMIGNYDIGIAFHAEVPCTIKLVIEAEKIEKKEPIKKQSAPKEY